MTDFPQTVQDMRTRIAVGAARASHVFDRTLFSADNGPMPAETLETNMMAHFGTFHGFALAEVLRMIEARGDAAFTEEVLATVNDIGANGDDGRCDDIWPDVEAKLMSGGVGTPAWDEAKGIS